MRQAIPLVANGFLGILELVPWMNWEILRLVTRIPRVDVVIPLGRWRFLAENLQIQAGNGRCRAGKEVVVRGEWAEMRGE